ncbi:MAG TPA: cupredoxin domain-containing protein [Patescibacteria group bacterium]|nr:cupredoxin domain-containing protein [Patescibacteria group bacterium]
MQLDKVIVVMLGITGIIFTYWFFLMKKDKVVKAENSVDILVEGGYSPNAISIPKGKTTILNFLRRDPSSCLEEVVIPNFKIRKFLPLNTNVAIPISPDKAGEYEIVCGMNMFHGKILVK